MGLFKKINSGLKKTRDSMSGAISSMLGGYSEIDDELYEELEEILVMGDVGVKTAQDITSELRKRVHKKNIRKPEKVKELIQEIVADMLRGGEELELETIPSVILVIGVNGAGKTTTIGKMAALFKAQGKKVILGAADTFRAAAIEQLEVWAERAGVDIIKHKEGADPAAVVFDTVCAGKAREADIIICDTAGRLHNKKNLMEELAKIYKVIDREMPYSDREVLLVLDATTGQNAVNQAKEFKNVADITGIILTKLDGTARGGVVLAIKNDLGIPVKFIGVGEKIDDLQPFSPEAFAKGLFEAMPENEEEDENEEAGQKDDSENLELTESEHGEDASSSYAEEAEGDNGVDFSGESYEEPQTEEAEEMAVISEEETEESDSEAAEEEPKEKEEKKRRGFFGLFNRNS